MAYNMAMRRTRDKGVHVYKHCFLDWQACKTACDQVRKQIYPDAREYPYGGDNKDDYRGGYTAEVAIRFAQQTNGTFIVCTARIRSMLGEQTQVKTIKRRTYQSYDSQFTTIMPSITTVRKVLVVRYNRSARCMWWTNYRAPRNVKSTFVGRRK